MPPKKGSKNAAKYQRQLVERTMSLLNDLLADMNSSGALFENITSLSKFLEKRSGASSVTLRRNPRYRELLDKYLNSQRGAVSVLSKTQKDQNILKTRIKLLEIENSNKATKIRRLEAALSNLTQSADITPPPLEAPEVDGSRNSYDDFTCTANLVLALLELLPGVIVDSKRRVIIDEHSLSSNDVVATENLAGPFINWMLSRDAL
ncbi:hypothetical protein SAMN04488523_1335 [Sulfitobacter brevis]|uniref:Uncharacterized protein n=1 Tax=Sulfitobacter brevis TaxID=74348 RepID=A0A1I2H110_9RHOB|nr:hypothetical protein [Sulfitobacter brevis]SFF22496.1 hypothetical protein SAMN04488523_1335 [Sulfitobacter brevis]